MNEPRVCPPGPALQLPALEKRLRVLEDNSATAERKAAHRARRKVVVEVQQFLARKGVTVEEKLEFLQSKFTSQARAWYNLPCLTCCRAKLTWPMLPAASAVLAALQSGLTSPLTMCACVSPRPAWLASPCPAAPG